MAQIDFAGGKVGREQIDLGLQFRRLFRQRPGFFGHAAFRVNRACQIQIHGSVVQSLFISGEQGGRFTVAPRNRVLIGQFDRCIITTCIQGQGPFECL